jgi:hypothetical protein
VLVLHLYGVTTGSSSSSESVGVCLRPVSPLVFFTTLVGDTLRLFKVEVVGAMVSNILGFVGVFHIDSSLLVPNTNAADIG